MGQIFQLGLLLVQLFPSALKAFSAWQVFHSAQLDRERRAQMAKDIQKAVQDAIDNKSTAGLEDAIRNLGKPVSKATEDPKNPS